ncbi:MAG: tetratricopeptide repeat protein [Gammaproteobacteria bacterium]
MCAILFAVLNPQQDRMSEGPYIFEPGSSQFDELVLFNSRQLPVLVEFMGVWSESCITLEQRITTLAKEFPEDFIFARVDIDVQQELRERYGIEQIPTLMVFRDGEAQRTEVGELGEQQLRALLRDFGVFRQSDADREEARQLHLSGDTPAAIIKLTQAIRTDPSNTRIALDMVQIFIDIEEFEQARGLFEKLPQADRASETGKSLNTQLLFSEFAARTAGLERLAAMLERDPADHAARFDYAVCLAATHDPGGSLDSLFRILEADPGFRDGAARELAGMLVKMLMQSEPELGQNYRRKLGNLLAS